MWCINCWWNGDCGFAILGSCTELNCPLLPLFPLIIEGEDIPVGKTLELGGVFVDGIGKIPGGWLVICGGPLLEGENIPDVSCCNWLAIICW